MTVSLGSILLLSGIALCVLAQFGMAVYAFTRNPLKGFLCLIVPMYIVVYVRKTQTGSRFLLGWYLGVGLLVAGGILAS